jgi:nicotinamide-nucleotide amidase
MNHSIESNEKLTRLSAELVKAADARGLTLATAESCTAGALALLLSQAPGASGVLHGGFVVYTKENKSVALGIAETLIARHSAVSAEVAQAMARGALERCPADIVVAITGVTGPAPDEDGNPVGLVHLAATSRTGLLIDETHHFHGAAPSAVLASTLEAALRLFSRATAETR